MASEFLTAYGIFQVEYAMRNFILKFLMTNSLEKILNKFQNWFTNFKILLAIQKSFSYLKFMTGLWVYLCRLSVYFWVRERNNTCEIWTYKQTIHCKCTYHTYHKLVVVGRYTFIYSLYTMHFYGKNPYICTYLCTYVCTYMRTYVWEPFGKKC